MSPEQRRLVTAIDELEYALACHFADKNIPMDIQQAVATLEVAMSHAGLSPLAVSGIAQRQTNA